MTVQQLIDELNLCNPDLEVVFKSDADVCSAVQIRAVEFRSFDTTDDADIVTVSFSGEHQCVLLLSQPTDIVDDDEGESWE